MEEIQTVRSHLQSLDLPQIRWIRSRNIHLTLKFIGDIHRKKVAKISDSISQAVRWQSPFSISAAGGGVFPDGRRPRILWIGIRGETGGLTHLQKRVDIALQDIGFPGEKQTFMAHLTIGRIKGTIDPSRMAEALQMIESFESRRFTIQEVVLFQSELQPQGAIYTRLKTISLNI
jgi:2'-5' RNA ligase